MAHCGYPKVMTIDYNVRDHSFPSSPATTTFRPLYSPYDLPDCFVPLYDHKPSHHGPHPSSPLHRSKSDQSIARGTADHDALHKPSTSLRKCRSSFALSDIFEDDEIEIEILPPSIPSTPSTSTLSCRPSSRKGKWWLGRKFLEIVLCLRTKHTKYQSTPSG